MKHGRQWKGEKGASLQPSPPYTNVTNPPMLCEFNCPREATRHPASGRNYPVPSTPFLCSKISPRGDSLISRGDSFSSRGDSFSSRSEMYFFPRGISY